MHYRVYELDPAGHIMRGDWIEADSDHQAQTHARKLCGRGAACIELWQGTRRLAVLPCEEPVA